jgi:hypothetical protein
MSEIAAPPAIESHARARSVPTLSDRVLAATPLLGIYVVFCGIYVVEAWKRVTPWLFTDELELTQLSRSIATTGHAARRGEAHSPDSIYTYLIAPLWRLSTVAESYASVKYFDVFVMASVLFPTYFLARMIVRRPAALFAAAGAAAIPSLAYSSYIVEEPLAYPYAALCFFLIAKAFVEGRSHGRRSYAWWAAAGLFTLAAGGVKGELVIMLIVFALTTLFAVWSSDRARLRRRSWTIGDWIGTITLVFGAIFFISAVASHHSQQWYGITTYYKHRILNMGGWAAGSLALGIGVVPVAAGLAALFRAPGEARARELRMFRCVALSGIIAFGMYTGMKAAYLSTVFATRVEERNLIYIAPLLFVGAALVLDRRRVNLLAFIAASAYALYLVCYAVYHPTQTPYEMGVRLYSDALGLSIAQEANLVFYWTPTDVRWAMLVVFIIGTLVVLSPRLLKHRPRVVAALTVALGIAVVGWNLTGEISAAAGTDHIGKQFGASLERPFSWVDTVAHGKPTIYFGQGVSDQTTEWMLEFWNKSISSVTSVDGTIGGPGPAGSPNLAANGTLYWTPNPADLGKQYDYAVEALPCVDFAGKQVATHDYLAGAQTKVWSLVALSHPNRFVAECTGISPDGWSGPPQTDYYRFASGKGGWLRVVISRRDWAGPTPPTPVHVQVGTLSLASRQPALGTIERQINLTVASGQTHAPIWVHAPADRFAVRVLVDDLIVPCQVEPAQSSDCRQLGAEISFRFFRHRPIVKRHKGA